MLLKFFKGNKFVENGNEYKIKNKREEVYIVKKWGSIF